MSTGKPQICSAAELPLHQRALLASAIERHQRGDVGQAESIYREILSAIPHCIDALHFLGLAATQRGAWDEAISLLRRAVSLVPSAAAIYCSLARALLGKRDWVAVIAATDSAIALEPANVDAWFYRGNAHQLADAHEQAVQSYDYALRGAPAFAAALNNKAHSLRILRRLPEARDTLSLALQSNPSYAMALNNQGLVLLELNLAEDALESFDAAIAAAPNFAEAMSNRGTALTALKRFAEAAMAFQALAEHAPGFGGALGNLLFARRNCCDWEHQETLGATIRASVRQGKLADSPLSFLYTSDNPSEHLTCARIFSELRYPASPMATTAAWPYAHRRIRVAYLSGDFGEHAVSYLLAAVIERHDRSRFETIAIGWGRHNDGPTRLRLEAAFEKFVDATNLSDRQVATLLRDSEVDIAVDLMGHTNGQRTGIFALRAAPLQVSMLGYPGTSGSSYMDYLIADAVVITPVEERSYTERVVYLPHCCLPTDDRRALAAEAATREHAGLPAQGFVFCVFNSPVKFTRRMFHIWLRLLGQVPGSVLWLRTSVPEARRNLKREAESLGLGRERLVFADALASIDAHLARYRLADLFLDTLPYNAHATACDALWAGLPVLTCRGRSFAGRVGASLLEALGLPELITTTLDEYETRAQELARNPAELASIRGRLEHLRGSSPLFDTALYARHLESAYESMWSRYRSGMAPLGFSVESLPRARRTSL